MSDSSSAPRAVPGGPQKQQATKQEHAPVRRVFFAMITLDLLTLLIFSGTGVGAWLRLNNGAVSALAALIVAWFTYTLWRSTRAMQRVTSRQLGQMQREFDATHRPKVRLRKVYIANDSSAGLPFPIVIHIELAATEGTDAPIGKVQLAFGPYEREKYIPFELKHALDRTRPEEMKPEPGGSYLAVFQLSESTSQEFHSLVRSGGSTVVYGVGYVRYTNSRGEHPRRTGFLVRFDAVTRRFIRENDPDWTYED